MNTLTLSEPFEEKLSFRNTIVEAIYLIKSKGNINTSLISKYMWFTLKEANSLMEELEELWIIWADNWARPRHIFIYTWGSILDN